MHPEMLVSITAGGAGSWAWDGSSLSYCPSCEAEVASAAGAGDAHLAGIVVGLTAGLSLPEAQQLGTLVAGISVTSPHTIAPGIDRESLRAFSENCGLGLVPSVRALLEA
jgi:sugar/nucleoside kinase (ribokinase family)